MVPRMQTQKLVIPIYALDTRLSKGPIEVLITEIRNSSQSAIVKETVIQITFLRGGSTIFILTGIVSRILRKATQLKRG